MEPSLIGKWLSTLPPAHDSAPHPQTWPGGAYPALHEAVHSEGTRSAFADLVEGYLGATVRYQQTYGLPLIDTLAAYFANNANVAATARTLRLNRQSLLYRLARFEEVAGVDLRSPGDRFALELALHCLFMTHRPPARRGHRTADLSEATG